MRPLLRPSRLAPRVFAALLTATLAGTALAAPEQHAEVTPENVWSIAESSIDASTLAPALAPERWEHAGADESLLDSLTLLEQNIEKREALRASSIEEAINELAEHIAQFEESGSHVALSDALSSAVSLQLLMNDDDEFFGDAEIRELIRVADKAAHDAEDNADWVIASELYYRLDAIHDSTRQYKEDVTRLARRLGMIRLYTPERLWELRNNRRLAEELDPLPPYNPYGDAFTDKLRGIDSLSVRTALQRASAQHVGRRSSSKPDGVTLSDLIVSGLGAIRTMATTTDLSRAFPGLSDNEARSVFIAKIDDIKDTYDNDDKRASAYDLRRAVDAMMSASQDTVGIMPEALLHEFGNGAMAALDDYTAIIWPDEVARFQRSTQGEFIGVGIRIQHDELMNIEVVTPLEGTPAQRAGLRAGDVITKVDGISAVGLGLDQAVEVITGPPNTDVTITVEREDEETQEPEELTFTLTRAKIDIPTVKGWSKTGPGDTDWDYFIDDQDGVGYLRLTGFTEDSTNEFDAAIKTMKDQGLEALILDLRYNPGGLLDQAVSIASRFVPGGMIVKTVDASGMTQDKQNARAVSKSRTLRDIPVVVLVNEGSASASEIVSGAIQAAAQKGLVKARVVGQRSFGKGSVQNVFVLPGGRSAMKLTTQYYHVDADRMIHRLDGASEWGVEPDIRVEMLPEQNADALILRRDADIFLTGDDAGDRPNPDDLLRDGTDLQVQTALVLLKTQLQGPLATTMRD